MIPLVWLKLVPWRAVGAGMGVVAVMALGWRVSAWREAYKALPAAQEALLDEQECNEGSKCAARVIAFQARQDAFNREVADAYARQIDEIAARPPAPVVRLCRPRGSGGVPSAQPAGAADAAAPGGVVPIEASGDIGQRLFDLADDADREAVKLRSLQQWNQALSTQPKT